MSFAASKRCLWWSWPTRWTVQTLCLSLTWRCLPPRTGVPVKRRLNANDGKLSVTPRAWHKVKWGPDRPTARVRATCDAFPPVSPTRRGTRCLLLLLLLLLLHPTIADATAAGGVAVACRANPFLVSPRSQHPGLLFAACSLAHQGLLLLLALAAAGTGI